jgi:CHAD domain-containing protein
MLSNTIGQVYNQHERSFVKGLKKAKTLAEKPVHQLRLDIKSLRSLLELMEAISKKKIAGKATRKILKPLFRQAGKLRTTALNLYLTRPYRSAVLAKFRKYLEKKQAAEGEKLLRSLKGIELKKLRKLHKKNLTVVKKSDNEELTDQAVDHLRDLLAGVRSDLFDINNDETLHEIRRQLKRIRNIGHLLDEAKVDHPFKEELKKVSATYEKIGKWHDTVDLINELEKFVDNLHEPTGLEKTVPLILKLKKESLKNKRQIARKLRADLVRPPQPANPHPKSPLLS